MKIKRHRLPAALLQFCAVIVFVAGCSNQGPERPPQSVDVSERLNGEILLAGERILVVRNSIGHLMVAGNGPLNSLQWVFDKETSAETKEKATAQLKSIRLASRSSNDTVYIDVESPAAQTGFYYFGAVSLAIPYRMACLIEEVSGETKVSYLGNTLLIRHSKQVDVQQHNGSCQINSSSGNISSEIALPDSGFCKASTGDGNILLKLPASTSATVFAKTGNGTITNVGLSFTNLNQQALMMTGTLGSGKGEIRLETNRGNIQLQGL